LKEFLDTIDFQSKSVLEVGFGPGGNLKNLAWYQFIDRHFILRHQEGEPISPGMEYLIGLPMPITRLLDEMFVEKGGLAKMIFQRT
jgi:hypothetical protein